MTDHEAMDRFTDTQALFVNYKVAGVSKTAIAFLIHLFLRLVPKVDRTIPTACVDGKTYRFNPDWLFGLEPQEVFAVHAHETWHCAMLHHTRKGDRDHLQWNIATDLVINWTLKEAGFRLPDCALLPGVKQFARIPPGLTEEETYDLLLRQQQEQQQEQKSEGEGEGDSQEGEVGGAGEDGADAEEGDGKGSPGAADPGGCGSVCESEDSAAPADLKQQEAQWQAAVAQAADAIRDRGDIPGWLERIVGKVLKPVIDWRTVLHDFVNKQARSSRSFARPSRRAIQQGLYLPTCYGNELGEVIALFDVSGSITMEDIQIGCGELISIIETYDCTLTVVYHDVRVTHVQRWEPGDPPLKLQPMGGGGTSHVQAFEWVEQNSTDDTACIICITDLETRFPQKTPALPVLWVVPPTRGGYYSSPPTPPFGQVVRIQRRA